MNIIEIEKVCRDFKVKKSSNSILKDMFKPDYKTFKALKNITFNVAEGESVALLGKNGAGKTTLTKCLTGLLAPTSGKLKVLGFTPFDKKDDYLKQIGLVMGGKQSLNWDLTPDQNLWLNQKIYEIPEKEYQSTKGRLCNELEVSEFLNTQVRKLSLGQRMKFELIASIIHKPKILFLDEPTIGLDINTKAKVRKLFNDFSKNEGATLILTSHDTEDIEEVSDRIIVLDSGKLHVDTTRTQLKEKYMKYKFVTVQFKTEESYNDGIKGDKSIEVKTNPNSFSRTYQQKKSDVSEFIDKALQNPNVLDVDFISVPLESIISDIFNS